ncbi:MAG TPA: hypothetical protein PK253_02255 [Spirochaetota bacterium]|nr:hypothetical protein [Spirochaetota bacterium]
MKYRRTIYKGLCLIAFLASVSVSSAEESGINIDGNVEARNQSGVHHGEVYRNYLKADLNFGKNFGNTVVKVTLRAEDDSIRPEDDPDNQYDYLRSDDTGPRRAYLREAYISHDIYFDSIIDSINLKMGRIIYTWGNSDEVKPVDIINPQDYSNLYFTLIQERKYGVFSGAMSIFFTENFFIEGVVIPEFRPSEFASNVFVQREFREVAENPILTLNPNGPEMPDAENRENSYAGRLGLTLFDIDMHVNYFYGYDHIPAFEMELTSLPPAPAVTITPVYKQVQMVGFDFQRALFWGISLRGEGAYYERGKFFRYSKEYTGVNPYAAPLFLDLISGGNGSVEKDYIEYTVGFDDHDFIFDDLYVNVQYHQQIILDYEDELDKEQYVNMVLWNVRYYMFNKKFCISTRGAYDTGDKSVYANGEIMVKLADNFEFMVGGWMIEGREDTLIGQFDYYDMVYVAGRLTF